MEMLFDKAAVDFFQMITISVVGLIAVIALIRTL